ncbi:MAG TPA: hypothetical protein VHE61_02320 [Opitutaceae bacterium]|nr:hypothetical protein [Opitutaceae bacterium]
MNYSITRLLAVAGAAVIAAAPTVFAETHNRASAPTIITPPAVPDGSNMSRAPFPAARPFNDVLPPSGHAIPQDMPPNTPSTNPDPIAPPPPAFAILQPREAPGLMPTGRPSTGASVALDPAHMEPAIRSSSFASRDDIVDSVRVRMRQSEVTMLEFRRTESDMSPEGRTQFRTADDEVRARGKQLEHSLRAAARASSENWDAARAQLAADYDAYADALASVDTAVGVAPARR